jgi:hypothetical protein
MEESTLSTRARATLTQGQPSVTARLPIAPRAPRAPQPADRIVEQALASQHTEQAESLLGPVARQVEQRPWVALGVALAAGFALGSLGGGEAPRDDYYTQATALPEPPPPPRPSRAPGDGPLGQIAGLVTDQVNGLGNSAAASALGMFRDAIARNVPELHRELERVRSQRGRTA